MLKRRVEFSNEVRRAMHKSLSALARASRVKRNYSIARVDRSRDIEKAKDVEEATEQHARLQKMSSVT